MSKFLIRSVLFFLFAALVSVGVFFLVSLNNTATVPTLDSLKEAAQGVAKDTESKAGATAEEITKKIPEEGIPLASLPLTDAQKKALEAVQIDVDTFVLTKTMLTCGAEKLGESRMAAIAAGEAPSILETTKLLACLTK